MVADRLNKLRTDIEDTYQAINEIGGTIPSDKNTNNISEAIRSVYDNLPKVSDTGTNVSLSPTLKGRLGIVPKGNTLQDGEPTPDTPVEIQSATGTQKVVVSGKNLFDKDNNVLNAYINATGYVLTSSSNMKVAYAPCKPNTTYTISKIKSARFVVASYSNLDFGAGSTNGRSDNDATSITLTTDANAKYICVFYYHTSDTISEETIRNSIQIEANSTATPYQPYIEPQEVDIELSSRNKWDEEWEQGYYNANGNPVGNTENAIRSKNFIPVLPETNIYYYNGTNNGGRICFYDNNKNFISTITNSNVIRTTPANCYYIMFSTSTNYGSTYNNDICINISDEKNGTYTPYYNYTPNKIGDYEDYIDGTPDNWVLYKKIRKLELAIADMNNNDNYPGWGNVPYLHNDYPSRKDPSFPADLITNIGGDKSKIGLNTNGVNSLLFLNKGSWGKTQTQWKEQYPNLVFELVYGLQKYEQTPITEENLISQLNELYYLQSYNDTTNVDVTGNLPMRITASAIKGA